MNIVEYIHSLPYSVLDYLSQLRHLCHSDKHSVKISRNTRWQQQKPYKVGDNSSL